MKEQQLPIAGRYRHYKGGEYQLVSIAKHSETRELLVVYRCLYDGASWWVRPLEMFVENVTTEEGIQPRFALLKADEGIDEDVEKTP